MIRDDPFAEVFHTFRGEIPNKEIAYGLSAFIDHQRPLVDRTIMIQKLPALEDQWEARKHALEAAIDLLRERNPSANLPSNEEIYQRINEIRAQIKEG